MRLARVLVSATAAAVLSLCTLLSSPSASAQDSPNLENGLKAYGSYDETAVDTVNLSNGNLILHVPLPFSYAQRGGKLGAAYYLVQNSKSWQVQWLSTQTGPFYFWAYGWRGLVSTALTATNALSFQRTFVTTSNGNNVVTDQDSGYFLQTWDGATHQLTNVGGNVFETGTVGDLGGGFRMVASNPDASGTYTTFVVTDRSGNVYSGNNFADVAPCTHVTTGGVGGTTTITCQQITGFSTETDANGNYLSGAVGSYSLGGVDTLGRTESPTGSASASTAGCVSSLPISGAYTENFVGPTGTTEQVKMCFGSLTFQTEFGQPSVAESQSTASGGVKAIEPLVDMVLPNGTQWTFNYDSYGNITSVGLPTGGSISYTWTTNTYPDCSGTNTLRSRAVASRTLTDGTTSHTWNYNWSVVQSNGTLINIVTDPLGNDTVHTFTPTSAGCYFYETTTASYSGSHTTGQLLRTVTMTPGILPTTIVTTDNVSGQVTQTLKTFVPQIGTNSPSGLLTVQKDYDWGPGAPGALLREVDTSYLFQSNSSYLTANILNLPTSIITKDGSGNRLAETDYTYDETAYLTSSGITTQHGAAPSSAVRGNPTTVSHWLNTTGSSVVSHTNWYDTGVIYQSLDPLSHPTTFAYSGTFLGAYPTTITNALGQFATRNYDFSTGLLTSTSDLNGLATTFSYDSMSRLSGATVPGGGSGTITRQETTFPFSTTLNKTITAAVPLIKVAIFDGFGRVKQTQLTSDPDTTTFVDTTYDGLGRIATVSNPHRSASAPTDGITTTIYDALNRVCVVVPPDGTAPSGGTCPASQPANTLFTTYSGNATTASDQAGKSRKSVADGLGRLTQVFEDPANLNYETDYTYDALKNLLTVNQKGGSSSSSNWRTRTFTYDSLSRLTQAINPESGTIGYFYDFDGNLLQKTSPAPNQTGTTTVTLSYCYDVLNRLTAKAYTAQTCTGGTLPTPVATYAYDQSACLGAPSCYNIGHRTGMADPAGTEAWSYDITGGAAADQRTTNGLTKTATYTHNLDGSLAGLSYPTAANGSAIETLAYQPGGAGRPLGLTSNGSGFVGDAHYTPPGAICYLQDYWDGTWTAVGTFNSRLQPATYQVVQQTSGTAPTVCTAMTTVADIMDFSYNFVDASSHNNGNVQIISNNESWTRTQAFTYDSLNRIATAETYADNQPAYSGDTGSILACWAETYTYDPWGNLTSLGPNSTTQPNYVGCTQESGFNYASFINTKNQVTAAGFTYDAAGNITASPGPVTYVYDAENHLTSAGGVTYTYDGDGKRVMKSNGTIYWYGASSDAFMETDLSNNMKFMYFFFNGQRVARQNNSNQVTWYFGDHLGSSRVVWSINGVDNSDYYPFGGERVITSGAGNQYKFTTKERDSESGLDNFGARYNSSSMGRFMSPDPLGGRMIDPQTLNKYSYVRNNPINFTDPTGLYTCKDDNNQCKTKQDIAFEKARQQDLKSKDKDVLRAANAYGDPTKDNHVSVGFADLDKKGEGGVTTSTLGADDKGNLFAQSDVTINSKISGSALDAAVGHEGSHVADAQDVVSSIAITDGGQNFKVGQDITRYQSEQRAYGVTDSILKSGNENWHFACGFSDCLLGTGQQMLSQRAGVIDQIMANSPLYRSNGQPLSPTNQGGSVVPH